MFDWSLNSLFMMLQSRMLVTMLQRLLHLCKIGFQFLFYRLSTGKVFSWEIVYFCRIAIEEIGIVIIIRSSILGRTMFLIEFWKVLGGSTFWGPSDWVLVFYKSWKWLVSWLFYGVSTFFRSFNAKLSHFDKSFKQFSLV